MSATIRYVEPAQVDDEPEPESLFNPEQHTVAEVNEYLAGVDDDEKIRVLEIEEATKNRKSII